MNSTMQRGRQGHSCWCCGRMRPNEKFSGRGHARHLCRDCAKLGKEELAYRQAVRAIERLIHWPDGIVRRKQRRQFERFLSHPNERVRRHAEKVAEADAETRATYRRAAEIDEAISAELTHGFDDFEDPCAAPDG